MPVFRPRSRFEIFRSMASRVVARSTLARLESNGAVFHILGSAASELAEIYFQLARLRTLFSIDSATGSDLDARAAEIQPANITRRLALFATGQVIFSRPGTTGTIAIPIGTVVAAQDASGLIKYRTTTAGSVPNGSTASAAVDIVAVEAGERFNVAGGAIVKFVNRISGVTTVSNAVSIENGRLRESDPDFRARLKSYVQSLTRATPRALEGFATNVQLTDGRRVLFAHTVEPIIPNGTASLYIDDGTGSVEEWSDTYLSSPDTILASAVGGEIDLFTSVRPIRDDGSFVVYVNGVPQVRNTAYYLNAPLGKIEMVSALTALDVVTCEYRYYTGLLQQVQRVIDGDPSLPLTYPGVRGAGIQVSVLPPTTVFQSISASITVADDFDVAVVSSEVSSAIQEYINTLNIGDHVIAAEIIERAMGVDGMTNFRINNLTGSTPPVADQVILRAQVARIIAASITLT